MTDEVDGILRRAEEVLLSAYKGLEMMRDPSGATKNLGLRNVLTFARSVTFVLQNLKGKHEAFEGWYADKQNQMKDDPVFSYFRDARNNLEKQGKLEAATTATVESLGPKELRALEQTKPQGATGMFIGDQLGGSGWKVELPNGQTEKFYVDMNDGNISVEQTFSGKLADKWLESDERSTEQLAEYVLEQLSEMVADAFKTFTSKDTMQPIAGKRLPHFIRVIK
ncbi:hypothetical protein Q4543_24250 [Salipiger sp. 1_MG-2023]|uniref:hypothetical protein n=1 Tax=Salipiger sp. 1_MG-2023 TaxID=3062665 RepID=UPI0026E12621|nr:hypothetical protein [Salipiger sp. 1_MG-2023]MDO6588561.1 hypothetical protein [Salipiger sp. 1_MG-2023]